MKIVNLEAHPSVVNVYMSEVRHRDYQTNRALFRNNLERIGHVMAYELSRTLNYSVKTVETPLAKELLAGRFLPGDEVKIDADENGVKIGNPREA